MSLRTISLRCRQLLVWSAAVWLFVLEAPAQNTGVYVGGHIRRERPATVQKLKHSGFSYVILFNINVETDGTLTTDGETVCRDGEYVFAETQPFYADDVRELKTWPTAIRRIEICIGGWGNESYSRIRSLVASEGTGESSILYRNFQALKMAVPEIDAVNNDDEHAYDVTSAVAFHKMMWQLGYHTSLAPYTRKEYWSALAAQLNGDCPGACDRVLLQCYDGGAANRPADWNLEGITLHAGRTNYQSDRETSILQMEAWQQSGLVSGAFVWVYNDETWNLNEWAAAMNRVFPEQSEAEPVATFYSQNNFGGVSAALPVGEYCTGQLASFGIADKNIASFKLSPGYQLELFASNDLTGAGKVFTEQEMPRMGAWGNRASSLRISPVGESGVTEVEPSAVDHGGYYDLCGRRMAAPPLKGLYIVKKNNRTVKITVQ